MLDAWVKQIAKELAMEDHIKVHEPGHFTLVFENEVKVDAFQKKDYSVLKSEIVNLPLKNTEALIEKVMETNLYTHGTRGSLIGLNADGNILTLSMEVDNNASYKDFFEKVEDFITVLEHWRKTAKAA